MLKENERKILKLLQTFGPLKQAQIAKYFENKIFGDVNGILRNLKRKRLVLYDRSLFQYSLPGWRKGDNHLMIKAFYVLLEFVTGVSDVFAAEPPSQIIFFRSGRCYEIAVIPAGQELSVSAKLKSRADGHTGFIIILENLEQARKITLPGILAVCTVKAGKVQFYIQEEEETHE